MLETVDATKTAAKGAATPGIPRAENTAPSVINNRSPRTPTRIAPAGSGSVGVSRYLALGTSRFTIRGACNSAPPAPTLDAAAERFGVRVGAVGDDDCTCPAPAFLLAAVLVLPAPAVLLFSV